MNNLLLCLTGRTLTREVFYHGAVDVFTRMRCNVTASLEREGGSAILKDLSRECEIM